MAELLKLRQAARLIGVSPGRLYRAIADGRLQAAPGGGPGKPTLVSREALQAFCQHEGLHLLETTEVAERLEHAERSTDNRTFQENMTQQLQQAFDTIAAQYLARIVERQSAYIDTFVREELTHLINRVLEGVVDQVVERVTARLERSGRSEPLERSGALPAMASPSKAELMTWLRTLRGSGMSLQNMAAELNARGIPTLSGKGRWQKGTIGKLLA